VRRRRTERPRWRDVKPAAAWPEPKGEKLGELEWVARKLTDDSIWTEDGRRGKLDERGGAP